MVALANPAYITGAHADLAAAALATISTNLATHGTYVDNSPVARNSCNS
jgi:hypothetical protein